jgi:hypothetical protein
MKKLIGIVFALAFSASALAGPFAGVSYDLKDDQNKNSYHDVTAFTMGTTINDRTTVAVKGEIESVRQNHDAIEGLVQAQGKFNVATVNIGVPVTAFLTGAVGEKFKAGNNFPFYAAGGGFAFALADDFKIVTAARWRDAFQNGRNYGTVEGSLGAEYTLNDHNVLGVRIAMERGALGRDGSDYNVLGASYAYKF